VDIDQVEHLEDHFVGNLTTVADDGFAVLKLLDAIFINAEACCPNSKQHCNKLARDAKSIAITLAELEEAGTKLGGINDGICSEVRTRRGEGEAE
jgi:hypothetical protein